LVSIQFSNVEPPSERIVERHQNADLPAYARLRANGIQPPQTKGCAELEKRANSQLEVELGKLIDPPLLRKHQNEIADGMALARDCGFTTADVAGWKKARDAHKAS
jgi:hypothetical protein